MKQESQKSETELLTVSELARFLKVGVGWVYSRSRKRGPGSIPKIYCGRYVRFPKGDVLSWLQGRQK